MHAICQLQENMHASKKDKNVCILSTVEVGSI